MRFANRPRVGNSRLSQALLPLMAAPAIISRLDGILRHLAAFSCAVSLCLPACFALLARLHGTPLAGNVVSRGSNPRRRCRTGRAETGNSHGCGQHPMLGLGRPKVAGCGYGTGTSVRGPLNAKREQPLLLACCCAGCGTALLLAASGGRRVLGETPKACARGCAPT